MQPVPIAAVVGASRRGSLPSFSITQFVAATVGGLGPLSVLGPQGEPRHLPPLPQLGRQRILSRPEHHFTMRIRAASSSSFAPPRITRQVSAPSGHMQLFACVATITYPSSPLAAARAAAAILVSGSVGSGGPAK